MAALERAERYVGQAFEVQFENAEIECLFDQQDCLFGKVLFVAYEGEDHADSETVAERQPGREIDGDDVLKPKDCIVDGCERDSGATQANIRAHDIGIAVEPLALAFALTIEELQRLNRPHGLDQSRALQCLGLDCGLAAFSKDAVESQSYNPIKDKRGQYHE